MKKFLVILLTIIIIIGIGFIGYFLFKDERPGNLKILPPDNGVYLGAYDWSGDGIKIFEQAIGKKVAIGKPSYIKDRGTEGTMPYFDITGHERAYQEGYITTYGIEITLDTGQSKFNAQDVIDGKIDSYLKQVASDIKEWGRPIFWLYSREPSIQPVPGFDGGGYGSKGLDRRQILIENGSDIYGQYKSPYGTSCDTRGNIMCLDGAERYRDMCRHIHDIVEDVAPSHVTWVMGANIGDIAGEYKMFYPGDNYVDWHAFDKYPNGEEMTQYNSFSSHVLWNEALSLANKPIIIVEFGLYKNNKIDRTNDRAIWFNNFFNDIRINPKMKNLKAFMYWQMTGMAFDDPTASTRIESGDPAAQVWQAEIKANPSFWLSDIKLK